MQEKSSSPIFNVQTVVLLVAIAANAFWFPGISLKSSRPSEGNVASVAVIGRQDADARLWQDPFEAISNHRKKEELRKVPEHHSHSFKALLSDIQASIAESNKLCVMPVFVTSSPYAEGKEWRIRTRYAILSALATANYIPQDNEHIGYCRVDWPTAESIRGYQTGQAIPALDLYEHSELNLTIPFEWFDWTAVASSHPPSCKSNPDAVLVLWLRDEDFLDFPLCRMSQLFALMRTLPNAERNMDIKMIGPYSTTLLGKIYENALELKDKPLEVTLNQEKLDSESIDSEPASIRLSMKNTFTNFTMLSCSSTAADKYIVNRNYQPKLKRNFVPREQISSALRDLGINFLGCILTDDTLADELAEELSLRGLDNKMEQKIVLISEWDTHYGRALPASMTESLTRKFPNTKVVRMSYLRGVDGQMSADVAGSVPVPQEGTKKESKTKSNIAKPEGNSQLDYIPRLVERLKEFNFTSRNQNKGQLFAIGILGSDVYDKLLLLQSLRPNFRDVIFFTTDLDARLWHPNELKWSRNLLVSSSYGLEVAPMYQDDIPPFRDSYQTAHYMGCLGALGRVPAHDFTLLGPSIFEVSHLGAKDLSLNTNSISIAFKPPRKVMSDYLAVWGWVGFVLLLGCFLLYRHSKYFREFIDELSQAFGRLSGYQSDSEVLFWLKLNRLGMIAILLFGVLLFSGIVYDHFRIGGKPFYLLGGVSLWPTEILRYVGIVIGILLLIKARKYLLLNKEDFKARYALPTPFTDTTAANSWYSRETFKKIPSAWWKKALTFRIFVSVSNWVPSKFKSTRGVSKINANALWLQYNWYGRFRHRILRAGLDAMVYFILAFALIKVFGTPVIPFRGPISSIADSLLLYSFIGTQLFVTFYVVDAVKLCQKFIENLTNYSLHWGEETYQAFEKKYGLNRAYLDELINITIIGERSDAVSKLVIFPFVLLFVGIIARASVFDRWDWPASLIFIYLCTGGYAAFSAFVLRKSAEEAREKALRQLRCKLIQVLGGEQHEQDYSDRKLSFDASDVGIRPFLTGIPGQLRQIQVELESYAVGAFAPLSRNPLIHALIMPFGGAGLLAILEYFVTQ
ncbi:MAG TPA: hypothetical protein VGE41_10465 [Verrucomicrobiae bacterium]